MFNVDDTIVAVATPPGRGGVAIVRVSGSKAYAIALLITARSFIKPRYALYTPFYDENRTIIDQGIVLYFKAPHSFTGEDVIEFQGHGAPVVMDQLMALCVASGARLAGPGEFSARAFLNDKMDLAQTEAVADLIAATSLKAARLALSSLQGDFSKQIGLLMEEIIVLRLYIEAAMDFSEEEINFFSDGRIARHLTDIIGKLSDILKRSSQGSLLREGFHLVIVGPPNVGKSTLINQLAAKDVAIVSPIAGTTRDIMREFIMMDDLPVHIIDTAGLRDSDDVIEQEGIRRALEQVSRADCILMMTDHETNLDNEPLYQLVSASLTKDIPIISIRNKIDISERDYSDQSFSTPMLGTGSNAINMNQKLVEKQPAVIRISAKMGDGIEQLKDAIKKAIGYQPVEGEFLARRRHIEALQTAQALLIKGQKQLEHHRAPELLAEDLRLAHAALGDITGAFSSDDLLGRIFSSFCIGK